VPASGYAFFEIQLGNVFRFLNGSGADLAREPGALREGNQHPGEPKAHRPRRGVEHCTKVKPLPTRP
jgi:hypothetical protein